MNYIYTALCQSAYRKVTFATAIYRYAVTFKHCLKSNLGLSVLPKDTTACGLAEAGIEPPTFRLVDEQLYLLSHSLLKKNKK